MCETKLVLLGTGTPNAEPFASGPSSAVVVAPASSASVPVPMRRAFPPSIPKISRSHSAPICTPTIPPGTPTCYSPHGCWSGRPP